ncbi:quinon protein alcohol dehydrogenase-like superfamily, partial [Gorgonomyces haynaldii]
LCWAFGFNPQNVHLITGKHKTLFYTSAHTGVLYDLNTKKQRLLLGHCHEITATSVCRNKRFLVTGDIGDKAVLIVWDMRPGTKDHDNVNPVDTLPIKTIFEPHGGFGTLQCDFTPDQKYLVSLGAEPVHQTICIWDWTTAANKPLQQIVIDASPQHVLRINYSEQYEFMTNGKDQVLFYVYDKETNKLEQHKPNWTERQVEFTTSCFLGSTGNACSGTSTGELIYWSNTELNNLSAKLPKGHRASTKSIKLHSSSLRHVSCASDKYIVTGGQEGFVKVFDMNFRILYWCEKLQSGPISSISFSNEHLFDDLMLPELYVATSHCSLMLIHRPPLDKTKHEKHQFSYADSVPLITQVLKGQHDTIRALVTHPELPLVAVAGDASVIQIWDYNTKQLIQTRQFDNEDKKQCIYSLAFSTAGHSIAVGFSNGIVRVLDSSTLQDLPQTVYGNLLGYKVGNVPVHKLQFSNDGSYLASADHEHIVSILHKETVKVKQEEEEDPLFSGKKVDKKPRIKSAKQRIEWVLLGRAKSHFGAIVSLLYPKTNAGESVRLFSVSQDRHVAEYDLSASDTKRGIAVMSIRRIEQIYRPMAAFLSEKQHQVHPEEFITCVNNGYKIRSYAAQTRLCRKTVLGPTFGNLVNQIDIYQGQGEQQFACFSTQQNYIGLLKFPSDGNPYNCTGVLAHPREVSNLISCKKGPYLISCGGSDSSMHMWYVNQQSLEAQISLFGDRMEAFLNMLDPSGEQEQSPIYQEFEDYFYYAQLKHQGEDRFDERLVQDTVPLTSVPSIMQAMGFYGSSQEMDDMINEVKYSRFAQGQGEEVESISFPDLIKLYLNHRPFGHVQKEELETALSHARRLEAGRPTPVGPVTKLDQNQIIRSEGLIALLQQYGESMSLEQIEQQFQQLLFHESPYFGQLPSKFTTKEYIEDLMGMQSSE